MGDDVADRIRIRLGPMRFGRPGVRLRPVRQHLEMRRSSDGEAELGFEVGLVEVREHAPGIGGLVLRVEVDLAIRGVGEAVQSLTRGGIAGLRFDRQRIPAGANRKGDTSTIEHLGGGEGLTIDLDEGNGGGDQVDERRTGRTGSEFDDCAGEIGLVIGLGVADVDMD